MKDLILELVPHAPQMGLYVAPHIPPDKLQSAIRDYAQAVKPVDVVALYDATMFGSAKDGAVFTEDRFVFQNNDLEKPQAVAYRDLVEIDRKKKLLGGAKVRLKVNRGRATFDLALDFSGRPEAAEYVERFLHEAMLRGAAQEMEAAPPAPTGRTATGSDLEAVVAALDRLSQEGALTDEDYAALLDVLRRGA